MQGSKANTYYGCTGWIENYVTVDKPRNAEQLPSWRTFHPHLIVNKHSYMQETAWTFYWTSYSYDQIQTVKHQRPQTMEQLPLMAL